MDMATGKMLYFGLIGRLLYNEPSNELLSSLDIELFDDLPYGAEEPLIRKAVTTMKKWLGRYAQGADGFSAEEAYSDYIRLFIGPGAMLAPPWGSTYGTEDRLVFQEQTAAVREHYRRQGLITEKLHHEPDDHIGVELGFLSHLAALESAAGEDLSLRKAAIDAQKEFLCLFSWVGQWNADIQKHARTGYYKSLGNFTVGGLNELRAQLEILS